MSKPILCLDFDGVIHSYTSGWQGPRTITDPPVPGALDFIKEAKKHFVVHIFSSRSRYWFARWAMKRWLKGQIYDEWCSEYPKDIGEDMFESCAWGEASGFVQGLKFPTKKPPAMLTIDDRALTFTGEWPTMDQVLAFKPWNKQVV